MVQGPTSMRPDSTVPFFVVLARRHRESGPFGRALRRPLLSWATEAARSPYRESLPRESGSSFADRESSCSHRRSVAGSTREQPARVSARVPADPGLDAGLMNARMAEA